MEKMNIVELDAYAANPGDLSWDRLKQYGNLIVYPRTSSAEVVERAKDADIVLVNKVCLTREIIMQLPRLKYIGVLATGYNVVDVDTAHERNIVVTNIPAYSTESVVQMVFAHILNITNRVDYYSQKNRNGRWSHNLDFCYWDFSMHELAGMTMGIVGLGNIGMRVAQVAHSFGMDVFALTSKNATNLPAGVQKTTLEGLLAVSDILTLHCPLTPSTFHLINRERLDLMKSSAILINTGRGSLVDEHAVAEALAQGKIAAYGADVMESEPPAEDNPLFKQPRAFITPHIAWATKEARQRLIGICADNIHAFLEGRSLNRL